MVATAASYGKISQSDNDRERDGGTSPSESLSPALSSSPMPFLPAVETTFTPLSMDSDFDANATSLSGAARSAGNQHTLHRTDASATDVKGHLPTSFGNAPASPDSALGTSQQGSYVLGQALYTQTKANFASNVGAGFSQDPAEDHASQHSARWPGAELYQPRATQQPVLVTPKPIVRTASTKSVSLRHPTPDLNPRSVSRASNIAQLEATAEKLSMTSSIDDAIRELHDEQKRVDSRRSSILAASIASIPEIEEPVMLPISKQISIASSIREANSAARHGGYSPAGYVMSPSSSMATVASRIRSGSAGLSKSDVDAGTSLSRHGPGKSSVRSVRSVTVPTLTNIAEIEPTALTAAAMDEADKLAEHDEDETLHIPQIQDVDLTPNANLYYNSGAHDYWDQPVAGTHQPERNYDHDRPLTSAGSDGTFEQAERAFADFDGAHCSPDVDLEDSVNFQTLFASPTMESSFIPSFEPDSVSEENEIEPSRPLISPPTGLSTVRPKSYLNPETGETMLYYPARVPVMLNLPQKLSKKPKTQAHDVRKSQALSVMPNANRQSTSWLPELHPEPLMDPLGPTLEDSNPAVHSGSKEFHQDPSTYVQDENQAPVESQGRTNDRDNRMSRISMMNPDKRRSQVPDMNNVPPQIRASAYFELPSQVPTIQLKDGSATNTLDDILNASASAPVSAFTDHAFAGSLGTEVYGTDKKRKSHMKHASTTELGEHKNRSSFFHLRKPSALSRHSDSREDRLAPDSVENNEEQQHTSSSVNGEHVQEGEGKEEEEEEDPAYYGPPTTLLAELQMRKHQQKLRTKPAATAFPNGMHSTLLELDKVAEVERQARKGKRVNLAWEDPSANLAREDEDEDTPLGLLLAAKGQDTGLIGAIPGAPRPLGLMERRDMEDNEPLSVRRNRLQGREAGPIQRVTLTRGLNIAPALREPSPQLRVITPEGDEVDDEDETLADRMRRLKSRDDNNPLPQHRPVSSAFSAELLSQLGDAFKGEEPETKDSRQEKGNSQVQPTEEEETLGQRRLRLQVEREAREREMARVMLNGGRSSVSPQLTKRHSLADVLGGHSRKTILSDPRVDAERARQEEEARYKGDQKRKFAALRHQMPSNLSAPNLVKPGGFMSGRFNDGTGGGLGQSRDSMVMGGFGSDAAIPNPALNASAMGNAFRAGGAMSAYGPPMTTPYASPYGQAPQVQSTGQMASIERWRQGIS
ncbi:hypothetical protein F4678DRAFT_435341 [Xylaria arbuscula]|nr:hypothetical protein F4678DRAFT_435341 [Xylaria arbuscula]